MLSLAHVCFTERYCISRSPYNAAVLQKDAWFVASRGLIFSAIPYPRTRLPRVRHAEPQRAGLGRLTCLLKCLTVRRDMPPTATLPHVFPLHSGAAGTRPRCPSACRRRGSTAPRSPPASRLGVVGSWRRCAGDRAGSTRRRRTRGQTRPWPWTSRLSWSCALCACVRLGRRNRARKGRDTSDILPAPRDRVGTDVLAPVLGHLGRKLIVSSAIHATARPLTRPPLAPVRHSKATRAENAPWTRERPSRWLELILSEHARPG